MSNLTTQVQTYLNEIDELEASRFLEDCIIENFYIDSPFGDSDCRIDSEREVLISERKVLDVKLDSILRLSWNLNWGNNKPEVGQIYNESNSPEPDIEYSRKNPKSDSSLIIDLTNKIEAYKLKVTYLNNIDTNSIISKIIVFVIFAVYPLRGLIQLLIWSIKTLKK